MRNSSFKKTGQRKSASALSRFRNSVYIGVICTACFRHSGPVLRRPLTVKRTIVFIPTVEQFPRANIRTYKEIKSL